MPNVMTDPYERLTDLKGEVHHLQNIRSYIKDLGPEVWCCAEDFFPHTGEGPCPMHPHAPRRTVQETLETLNAKIRDLSIEILDLELNYPDPDEDGN